MVGLPNDIVEITLVEYAGISDAPIVIVLAGDIPATIFLVIVEKLNI